MTAAQQRVLRALGHQSMTPASLAAAVNGRIPGVQRTLDALYRRSLVTLTPAGRWCATERGRKKLAA